MADHPKTATLDAAKRIMGKLAKMPPAPKPAKPSEKPKAAKNPNPNGKK